MGREENWKIPTDAGDFFGQNDRKLQIADRRPVIRKASDLVGPGIGAAAVQITDYTDVLATYNGYYSSVPGAFDAPNATDSFVGYVTMDRDSGGVQEFTSLDTGYIYRRVFTRNPADAESISFPPWTSNEPVVPPTPLPSYWVGSVSAEAAKTNSGWNDHVNIPTTSVTDDPTNLVFQPVAGGMQFNSTGLYAIDATLGHSLAVAGVRAGGGIYTTGSALPLVASAGVIFGGGVVVQGGTAAPYMGIHVQVRVTAAGAKALFQDYFQSTASRVASISGYAVHRLRD